MQHPAVAVDMGVRYSFYAAILLRGSTQNVMVCVVQEWIKNLDCKIKCFTIVKKNTQILFFIRNARHKRIISQTVKTARPAAMGRNMGRHDIHLDVSK